MHDQTYESVQVRCLLRWRAMVFGANDEGRELPIACSVNARSNYVCKAVLATWRQFTEIAALKRALDDAVVDLEAKAEAVEAAANAQPTRARAPTALPSIHGGLPSYHVPSPAEAFGWRSDSPEVDAP